MKRFIFVVLTILALAMGLYSVKLYMNKEPQQHTTEDLFEEIESWRD